MHTLLVGVKSELSLDMVVVLPLGRAGLNVCSIQSRSGYGAVAVSLRYGGTASNIVDFVGLACCLGGRIVHVRRCETLSLLFIRHVAVYKYEYVVETNENHELRCYCANVRGDFFEPGMQAGRCPSCY